MTEKMGEPSWYYCFRKLTYQEKKKKKAGTHRRALADREKFLTLLSELFYSRLLAVRAMTPEHTV